MAATPDQREQNRFVRVPVESVQSCVDQLGIKTTEEVPGGIVEDVSFRIRQLTDVSVYNIANLIDCSCTNKSRMECTVSIPV